MSLIKLNIDDSVSSTSATSAAILAFFKGLDKKALYGLIDDGIPSDMTGPESILDFRFIGFKNGVARFGIVTKDEDEDVGFNISGLDIRVEPEFDDEATFRPTLAEAKQALKALR